MKKAYKVLVSIGAFAVGFCSAAFFGTKLFVEVSGATKINNYSLIEQSFNKPDYPINKNGQTYGEIYNVMPENYPDLIGVFATNGKEGYVYKEDFVSEYVPQSPEEAVEYMNVLEKLNNQGIYFQVVPVYESDGKNVIGDFEISIDVGLSFEKNISMEEMEKIVAERKKLYEESRVQGKYLREDLATVMAKAKAEDKK